MPKTRSDTSEMPFLDHLEELRWRIIWSLMAVAVAIGIGFLVVLRYDILIRLEAPILPFLHGHHVMATHPTDGLQLTINAAMWIGAVLAFPVWSTLALAVPLYLLYELSVVIAYMIWRRRPIDGSAIATLLAPLLLLRAVMSRQSATSE